MTIIVFRNGQMAADTLMTNGAVRMKTTDKIVRFDGGLVGACGTSDACSAFVAWTLAGRRKADAPKIADPSFSAIVATPGCVEHYTEGLYPDTVLDPFVAIGAGSEAAYGALEMGATATEAARAAAKWIVGCGGEVETLTLD